MVGAAGADGIVTASAADATLTLPAASVAFAVKLGLPLARLPVVRVQAPLAFAVAVPTCVVPSNTVTVLLASAVPVIWTSVVPLTIEAAVSTGAFGATVSIVTANADDAALVPPEVVSVAVKLWLPFASVAVANVHAPLLFAVAVPSLVVPSYTVTVLLAAAVPVSVRVVSLVMWSPTTPLSVETEAVVGAAGADGIFAASAAEATLTLPAASVAFDVKLWLPLARLPVV